MILRHITAESERLGLPVFALLRNKKCSRHSFMVLRSMCHSDDKTMPPEVKSKISLTWRKLAGSRRPWRSRRVHPLQIYCNSLPELSSKRYKHLIALTTPLRFRPGLSLMFTVYQATVPSAPLSQLSKWEALSSSSLFPILRLGPLGSSLAPLACLLVPSLS
ncbi:hypothetical protein F5888DRAFT_1351907 [Russula emetica]|nr:hypothetical protein F5888DRAFT_1351907 [Russula emetica]